MPTPGLMFVTSKIIDPKKTSEEQYHRFYNEEHLPDVLNSKAANLALRYKNVDPEANIPNLVLYPVDTNFLGSPEHKYLIESTRRSRALGTDDRYERVDFATRPYKKTQAFEGYGHAGKSGKERGQTLVCVALEPADGQEQDFEEWYRKQHLDMLSMCRGYRRTTRYKRLDDQQPRYLALHEYDCRPEELPSDQIKQVTATEWTQKILKEAKAFERNVFRLVEAQGDVAAKL